ncbi:MAG TPA: integrase core domain-containing protein [Tepidisphaeraceae bacterium]|jgi:transposase InsO family protein
MSRVRISPYYRQSNGKTERWHQTLKGGALRPASPATLDEALDLVARFVDHYNGVRLHSALGYIAPLAFMAPTIPAERDGKLEAAHSHAS